MGGRRENGVQETEMKREEEIEREREIWNKSGVKVRGRYMV